MSLRSRRPHLARASARGCQRGDRQARETGDRGKPVAAAHFTGWNNHLGIHTGHGASLYAGLYAAAHRRLWPGDDLSEIIIAALMKGEIASRTKRNIA